MRLVGNHLKIAKQLQKHRELIQKGTMLSIDPGSRSPGWALWMSGRKIDSGTIATKGNISERLAQISDYIEGLPQADIVVIEKIGMIAKGTAQAHRYLFWSLGAIAGAARCKVLVEVPQNLWIKYRTKDYVKGDEADAIMIGKAAKEITK